MAKTNERAVKAAVNYLKRHDYEILEVGYSRSVGDVDIIAVDLDKSELVFLNIAVTNCNKDGSLSFPTSNKSREQMERISLIFLIENPNVIDIAVRFDEIGLCVLQDDNTYRAALRHHVNAYGVEK